MNFKEGRLRYRGLTKNNMHTTTNYNKRGFNG